MSVVAGAYSEDIYDLVWGYSGFFDPIPMDESPWISHTHFWDADQGLTKYDKIYGVEAKVSFGEIVGKLLGIPFTVSHPPTENAMEKLIKYLRG